MGSSDRHKVCFEVLGVPVIVRALETYNLCGSMLNVVVVGMRAESVMARINERFPGTVYAFQEEPRGTGDAARRGAEVLERMRFDGDVLVVAGDKMIEPRVVRGLLARHRKTRADVTLVTAKRPQGSTAGILLRSSRGNFVGILEEAERQRLVALARLNEAFQQTARLSEEEVRRIVGAQGSAKMTEVLISELWRGADPGEELSRVAFQTRVLEEDRSGTLRVGAMAVPVDEILDRFDLMNLSTYLFRAPVLYEALHQLNSRRPNQEEYLTDVIEILARRKKAARVVGYEIRDRCDLMGFNNPQELLEIEAVYRQKQGFLTVESVPEVGVRVAPAAAWEQLLSNPSAAARRQFRHWYGDEVPWQSIRDVLAAFIRRYGADRSVSIVRAPGRINLLGRHIDHQGGTVNVMAINREIILVASVRSDDQVRLANLNESRFSEQTFRISDMVANLDWDDWQRVIDGPRIQRILEAARGDWANYIKAALLRLQEQFRDRRLLGMDLMVGGDIPMGAGLSSSSALVVAAAEAATAFNRLPVSARRLVSLCGEGEWFVGTRGGAADHAAIKLSHRGYVTRVGFFPFQVEDSARFFPSHALVICNSGIHAGKSDRARSRFNEQVTAYHIGRIWFKLLRPDLAPRIRHLRDINGENLGLDSSTLLQLVFQLPARLSRSKVQAALPQLPGPDRDQLERLFMTHEAPAAGYAVRDVVLFGLSEMARARRCLDLLKNGEAAELGRLMTISHDGDRVSREVRPNVWRRVSGAASPGLGQEWTGYRSGEADIARLPGAYGCSLPELDRLVDIASNLAGVEGAQMAGAGFGGCVMALVEKAHAVNAVRTLAEKGIAAEVVRPIAGACSLTMV
jgi:N-acetylgalactosamine kinase